MYIVHVAGRQATLLLIKILNEMILETNYNHKKTMLILEKALLCMYKPNKIYLFFLSVFNDFIYTFLLNTNNVCM